jgi:chromosomal replication initiation ATPase DnaA
MLSLGKPAFRNRSRIFRTNADTVSACRDIESLVGSAFAVPLDKLRGSNRGSPWTAFARQVAMYLAHVELGLSLTIVGAQFGRDRTTVSHACGRVEDRRDDPALDLALFCLTAAITWHQRALGALVAQ